MHRVLQIHEILLNIFCYFASCPPTLEARRKVNSNLAALARTCRAFKEPALDILWSELDNPSPLIRCLPEISLRTPVPSNTRYRRSGLYSFKRRPERAEWNILCSYARRVWCLCDSGTTFDWIFITALMDFTPDVLLFPNLRSLYFDLTLKTVPLLLLPFPSLIQLTIDVPSKVDLRFMQDSLEPLAKTSPKIKRLAVNPGLCKSNFKPVADSICSWSNLQTITCPELFLDADALMQLPTLTQLTFALSSTFLDGIPPSYTPSFSNLHYLKLCDGSLSPVSRLLSWARLPAITNFIVIVDEDKCPSKQDLASFMIGVQRAGMSHTIQNLDLKQEYSPPDDIFPHRTDAPTLHFDDLQPCMAFHHLRRMNLDLEWDVNISDDELLALASAWPRLEELLVKVGWGWNMPGGITPNGLAQLLQTCPSLSSIALAIDTRGYTQLPVRRFPETASPLSFQGPFRINVLNSTIEEETVPAVVAFFASIVPHFHFILTTWDEWSDSELTSEELDNPSDDRYYRDYWKDVYSQANDVIKMRWLNVVRGFLFQH